MDNQTIIPKTWFSDHTAGTMAGNNPLVLPQSFSSTEYSKEQIAKSIFYYMLKDKHDKVVIASYVEGLNAMNMFFIDEIVRICDKKFNITPDKFVMTTGCFGNKRNLDLYKEACKTYNLVELDIIFCNVYEVAAAGDAVKNKDLITKDPLGYELRERPFLCFNGVAREHRVLLIGELFSRNLFHHTFLSCYDPSVIAMALQAKWLVDEKVYTDKFYKLFFEVIKHADLFPMKLSLIDGQYKSHDFTYEDYVLYSRSYISVVTETDFFQKFKYYRTLTFNCTFPTEKTYKPIKARHPFIIASRPHFLKHLRAEGYLTFHPHINESYDDIENDERRLNAIATELERLAAYSDQEWGNFLYHVNHICQHNFDVLCRKEFTPTRVS